MPHDMQAWQQFETQTGLPVVIDAAAAYGSQWLQNGEGTLVFSLHTTKVCLPSKAAWWFPRGLDWPPKCASFPILELIWILQRRWQ
jgi:hypothetical protein